MKVLIQWAKDHPEDWQVIDAADWGTLERKPLPTDSDSLDDDPGWISCICVQGVRFSNGDHYHVEATDDGGCLVTTWVDDQPRWALTHRFAPLAPDPSMGGAINTKQTRDIYVSTREQANLREGAPTDTYHDWEDFDIPADPIHALRLTGERFRHHRDCCSHYAWYDAPWTEHLGSEELDENKRLKQQREQGRYLPSKHTITYICRDTDRAAGWEAATHEDALELTTGTPVNETVTVAASSFANGWVFSTPAGDPGSADWPAGDYRLQYDVVTMDSGMAIDVTRFARVAGDLSFERETFQDSTDITTTGLTIKSINGDWAAGFEADRYSILVIVKNTNGAGDPLDITLELNTSDSFADGAWPSTGTVFDILGTTTLTLVPEATLVFGETKEVTLIIEDINGDPVINESNVQWWVSDSRDSAPTDSGASESTDGSGSITIPIPNTGVAVSGTVIVEVKLADGRYGVFEGTVS